MILVDEFNFNLKEEWIFCSFLGDFEGTIRSFANTAWASIKVIINNRILALETINRVVLAGGTDIQITGLTFVRLFGIIQKKSFFAGVSAVFDRTALANTIH